MKNIMKISIIIPAFNAAKTITECIDSILTQFYKDLEIIIVDDGSKDGTADIVQKIMNADQRITLIQQENQGASAARNSGLRMASGEFICFVDADDMLLPNMFQTLVDYQKQYFVDLVKSGLRRLDTKGVSTNYSCDKIYYYPNKQSIKDNFFEILSNGLNSPVGKLYKRSIIEKNNILFDEQLELSEDLHFNLQYLEKIESAVFVPDIFYQYNCYNSFLTTKYRENLFEKRKRSIEMLQTYLDKNHLDKNIISYLYIKLVFASAIQEIEHQSSRKSRLQKIQGCFQKKEVTDAIHKCRPNNQLEKILLCIIRYKNPTLIDISSWIIVQVKKLKFFNISRLSV